MERRYAAFWFSWIKINELGFNWGSGKWMFLTQAQWCTSSIEDFNYITSPICAYRSTQNRLAYDLKYFEIEKFDIWIWRILEEVRCGSTAPLPPTYENDMIYGFGLGI